MPPVKKPNQERQKVQAPEQKNTRKVTRMNGWIGNVGTLPELGTDKAGKPYARFRFAAQIYVPGETPDTKWYTVVCFGSLATNVEKSVAKGDRLVVVGREDIQTREHEGKTYENFTILADGIGYDLRFDN